MSTFGFDILNEFLPSFDLFDSKYKQRIMFLKLYNMKVSCKQRFTKKELSLSKTKTIFEIFRGKIYSLVPNQFNYSSKSFKLDSYKTKTINNFINKSNVNLSFVKRNKSDLSLAIKFIENFEGEDFKLFLDGEDVFQKFVSKRIKDFKADRKVKILDDEITIYPKGGTATKVYPYWQFLDKDNLENIKTHVDRAINCIKSDDCKQVYLVYPKHENFEKHINIKVKELSCNDYVIKVIPYSLRSILK